MGNTESPLDKKPADYSDWQKYDETEYFELDSYRRNRIRKLQTESNFTSAYISTIIRCKKTSYEHIVRQSNGAKNISKEKLIRLAALFNVTPYFLLYGPSQNSIDIEDNLKKIDEIKNYLYRTLDRTTINNLWYLFTSLPNYYRDDILKSFNSMMSAIMASSFWNRNDGLSEDKAEIMYKVLKTDKPDTSKGYSYYCKALKCEQEEHFLDAMKIYLPLIYHFLFVSHPEDTYIAQNAIDRVYNILKSNFGSSELKKRMQNYKETEKFIFDLSERLQTKSYTKESNKYINSLYKLINQIDTTSSNLKILNELLSEEYPGEHYPDYHDSLCKETPVDC